MPRKGRDYYEWKLKELDLKEKGAKFREELKKHRQAKPK